MSSRNNLLAYYDEVRSNESTVIFYQDIRIEKVIYLCFVFKAERGDLQCFRIFYLNL